MKNILVFGAGTMGLQIATYMANEGLNVKLFDVNEENLQNAENKLYTLIDKGKYNEDILEKLTFINDLNKDFSDIELVIEAVVEKKDVKNSIFKNIENKLNDNCIITSNSSSIVSSELLDGLKNKSRVCNLHFFNPVHKMNLVEIVNGEHTNDRTIEKLKHFTSLIDKEFIVVEKEVLGFVVNRVLASIIDEALYLYDNEYASFEDIDKAVKLGLHHPMGPFELLDYTGIDVNYYIKELLYEADNDEKRKPTESLINLYNKGDLGVKTGKGYYQYDEN